MEVLRGFIMSRVLLVSNFTPPKPLLNLHAAFCTWIAYRDLTVRVFCQICKMCLVFSVGRE